MRQAADSSTIPAMSEHVANIKPARGEGGKWLPGQSGNPKGHKHHPDMQRVKTAAAELGTRSIEMLAEIMEDREAQATARVRAAEIILERGFGRAAVTVEISADQQLLEAIDGLGNAQLRLLAAAMQAGVQQAQHVIEVESQPVQQLSHDDSAEQGGMQTAK